MSLLHLYLSTSLRLGLVREPDNVRTRGIVQFQTFEYALPPVVDTDISWAPTYEDMTTNQVGIMPNDRTSVASRKCPPEDLMVSFNFR